MNYVIKKELIILILNVDTKLFITLKELTIRCDVFNYDTTIEYSSCYRCHGIIAMTINFKSSFL